MRLGYLKILLYYWFVGWALLALGRLGLVLIFVPFKEIMEQSQFWGLALFNVIRFDIQTLAYIALIPNVAIILATHLKRVGWLQAFMRYYYSVVYTLMTGLIVGDLCFYRNFNSHFNITMFDFFNEGPVTLLEAFWDEYPVLWMCVAVVGVFLIVRSFKFADVAGRVSYVVGLVWLAFSFVAMRGSVVEFPLQAEDMYVSPSKQFNDCVPNATYSLKKALSEKRKAFSMESEEALLARFGFHNVDDAWQALGVDSHNLFTQVSDTGACQPDIVVILSESWSSYLCQLGVGDMNDDLLCGMLHHLADDVYLQNYQSVQNGTIATIENLTICTSFPRVFMSKYRFCSFPTSLAEPFLKSGYQTIFMSGMDEGWENVGVGLRNQGFSTVFKYELLRDHPEYTFNSIGIYDHHLMNSLYEYLQQKSSSPRLFVVMTTTNHPPFVYPDDVRLPSLPDEFYDNPAFVNARDVQQKYIKGFQYACLSIAGFLDRLKSSRTANNTVVVVTGDHNMRAAIEYGSDGSCADSRWRNRVPFYMYIPASLRGSVDGSYSTIPMCMVVTMISCQHSLLLRLRRV